MATAVAFEQVEVKPIELLVYQLVLRVVEADDGVVTGGAVGFDVPVVGLGGGLRLDMGQRRKQQEQPGAEAENEGSRSQLPPAETQRASAHLYGLRPTQRPARSAAAAGPLALTLERFPQSAIVHACWGDYYAAVGDQAKAVASYQTALRHNHDDNKLREKLRALG